MDEPDNADPTAAHTAHVRETPVAVGGNDGGNELGEAEGEEEGNRGALHLEEEDEEKEEGASVVLNTCPSGIREYDTYEEERMATSDEDKCLGDLGDLDCERAGQCQRAGRTRPPRHPPATPPTSLPPTTGPISERDPR